MNILLKLVIKILLNWLPLALTVTLCAFLVYGTVQHIYRSTANDPQIQISEDLALRLTNGAAIPKLLLDFPQIDISKSLAPFIVIFDDNGSVIASSGSLHGEKISPPPPGVLEYAKTNGQNRITWQPEEKVRQAIVVTYFESDGDLKGFVLAGKSLRELELREKNMVFQIFMWWGVALITTLIASSIKTLAKGT